MVNVQNINIKNEDNLFFMVFLACNLLNCDFYGNSGCLVYLKVRCGHRALP